MGETQETITVPATPSSSRRVGTVRVIGGLNIAHYRGSERTRCRRVFLLGDMAVRVCSGAHWFPRTGLLCVGAGGCVLFEKCIVDASI